ncbi:hypothetical protein FIU87_10700 [Bacillus sp. THAF10]|nr:hypothetical protein FIU87_10700 [Bacillus sp. THAF10]
MRRYIIILLSVFLLLSACKGVDSKTNVQVTQVTTLQENGKYYVVLGVIVQENSNKEIYYESVSIEGIEVDEQFLANDVMNNTPDVFFSNKIPSSTLLETDKLYNIVLISENPSLIEFQKAYINFNNYTLEYNR